MFNPYQARMARLIRRRRGLPAATIAISRNERIKRKAVIDNKGAEVGDVRVYGEAKNAQGERDPEMPVQSRAKPARSVVSRIVNTLLAPAARLLMGARETCDDAILIKV
ncbi:MAG: hypothetical protein JNN30_15360 [Rhodanobacteraceae bacterium]|nr:hypothetical protein [Rhodanobacteraceae bacterium]